MADEYMVHHGGLMRCCLASLDRQMLMGGNKPDETRLRCEYCNNPMLRDNNGVWRWDRDSAAGKDGKP